MKVYLIIYSEESNSDILKDRIKNLGNYYSFFKNNWFVKTELETSEEVYREITKEDMKSLNIIVLLVDVNASTGYWGFMNKALWQWMRE